MPTRSQPIRDCVPPLRAVQKTAPPWRHWVAAVSLCGRESDGRLCMNIRSCKNAYFPIDGSRRRLSELSVVAPSWVSCESVRDTSKWCCSPPGAALTVISSIFLDALPERAAGVETRLRSTQRNQREKATSKTWQMVVLVWYWGKPERRAQKLTRREFIVVVTRPAQE